jgi:hypothetical protein
MSTEHLQRLQTFRRKLIGVFTRRADALFELIDALLLTLDPRSPVELSASPAFRRRFSMVYDALRRGQIAPELARELLATAEPADAITVAGYAVYAVDTTVHPRADAETLPERQKVYSTTKKGASCRATSTVGWGGSLPWGNPGSPRAMWNGLPLTPHRRQWLPSKSDA